MIVYKNTKVKVGSLDGDRDFFDIVAGLLPGDTLAPYLFIICFDYLFQMSIDLIKENGFMLANDYGCELCWWHSAPGKYTAQAESLLRSLKWVTSGIGLHVNMDKTELMSFNQRGDISTLNERSLKLVEKFTYLRRSVTCTKNDINKQLAKVWTVIYRLSVILKSDLTDKIKTSFFQIAVMSILL